MKMVVFRSNINDQIFWCISYFSIKPQEEKNFFMKYDNVFLEIIFISTFIRIKSEFTYFFLLSQ